MSHEIGGIVERGFERPVRTVAVGTVVALVASLVVLLATGPVGAVTVDAGVSDHAAVREVNGSAVNQVSAASGPVDVVFVVDRSESMGTERYEFRREVSAFDERLGDRDARYGLVVYNDDATVAQPMTSDFSAIESSLGFELEGSTENASDALLTASRMDLRRDAATVFVLVSDEDDDSSAARRETAMDALDDATLVVLSPARERLSSCRLHTPPCDSDEDNELRWLTDSIDGEWFDVEGDTETVVPTAASYAESAATITMSALEADTDGPVVREVSLSANRTDVAVGEPVGFEAIIENVGGAPGHYDAQVTTADDFYGTEEIDVDPGETGSATITHRFAEPGEYTVFVSHEFAARVTVHERVPTTVTTNVSANGTVLNATVTAPHAGESVSIPVDGLVAESLSNVTVMPAVRDGFGLTITAASTPPNGTESLPDGFEGTYVTVNGSLPADGISDLTVAARASIDGTALYGYDGNASQWRRLDVATVAGPRSSNETIGSAATASDGGPSASSETTGATDGATGDRSLLVARTAGYDTVAIGVPRPRFEITTARLNRSHVSVGEPVAVRATVANTGRANGTYAATLTVDGSVVTSETVTVPHGDSRRVRLTYTPTDAGWFGLSAGNGSAHTLRVDADTPEPTTTERRATQTGDAAADGETETASGNSGADEGAETAAEVSRTDTTTTGTGAGFGPVVALLALTVALAVAVVRRRT